MHTGKNWMQNAFLAAFLSLASLLMVGCGRESEPDVLVVAKRLAETRFKGYTYGDKLDKKQINCVQFVVAVVEELVQRGLTVEEYAAINISHEFEDLDVSVANGDDRTRGIQRCLVDILGIAETIERDKAAPGDFIQYWYKTGEGHWSGHVAIVNSVWQDTSGNFRVSLFGSHKSSNGIAEAWYNGGLVLNDSKMIYICRLIHGKQ